MNAAILSLALLYTFIGFLLQMSLIVFEELLPADDEYHKVAFV